MRALTTVLIFLVSQLGFSAEYPKDQKVDVMPLLKKVARTMKVADTLEEGIRLAGQSRDSEQFDEVFNQLKGHKHENIRLDSAVFFKDKIHVSIGGDITVMEIVDLKNGEFKINNKKLVLTPFMTFKQAYDEVAKVMGVQKTAGIPFLIPAAHASFFGTLLKISGIAILGVSAVDLFYFKTHSTNKRAIASSAQTCKGFLELQKNGNAPASTNQTVQQLEQLVFAFKDVKEAQCGSGLSYVLRASLVKAFVGACGDAKESLSCLEKYSENKSQIDPKFIKLMTRRLKAVKPVWTNNDDSNAKRFYVNKARAIDRIPETGNQ